MPPGGASAIQRNWITGNESLIFNFLSTHFFQSCFSSPISEASPLTLLDLHSYFTVYFGFSLITFSKSPEAF